MVDVQNSEIFEIFGEDSKCSPLMLPHSLAKEITPVMVLDAEKYCCFSRDLDRSSTGSATILTTDPQKETYIVGATLSTMSNATADNTITQLTVVINGATRNLILIPKLSVTAQDKSVRIDLTKPLRIDKNSIITISSTFTVGACYYAAQVQFYTKESYKKG